MINKLILILPIHLFCCLWTQAQQIENVCRGTASLYSNMWWKHSIKTQSPRIFAIQTNKYAFEFDYEKLNFNNFSIVNSNQNINALPDISFGVETDGKLVPCQQSSLRTEDCQLIHTGPFLQHRFINWIPGLTGCDPYQSGLEVVSWNDRLSLSLRVVPSVIQRANSILFHYKLPSNYERTTSPDGWFIYKNRTGNDGFVITGSTDCTAMSISGNTIEARCKSTDRLQPGQLYQTGIILYPVENLSAELSRIIQQESNPLLIHATQISPIHSTLDTQYNKTMGWHTVQLRNDLSGDVVKDNDRMERVQFTIENKNPTEATIRLNFNKEGEVYAIPGISGILRDEQAYPIGIPVQLSKNWHATDFNKYDSHLYKGPWFHGISALQIPGNSKITLEFTSVNAHWGGIPAASHAQLCLVGWGNNQQWDQSAIGAWGESICYEPDLDQASAAVLDIRPLLIVDPKGEKWHWTGNVGGADILNLRLKDNSRAWHTAMKTDYKRYCPNLTEVTYSGNMSENKIEFRYTTSIGRSDDMTRGIYKIKMKVNDHIEFDKLDIFQLGAATYHYGSSRKTALGNEAGLIRKWEPRHSGSSKNNPAQSFTGNIPWIFMYDSPISKDQEGRFVSGDRGFIIRSWKAKINGQTNVAPHWREYISTEGFHGDPCPINTVTLPETCHSLSPGDYIEAEIEMFVTPLKAEDYYGPNLPFLKALSKHKEKWPLAHREALGNNIKITASKGLVEASYPIIVRANDNQAQFNIRGGIGYVPITIKGLSSYKKPVLYIKTGRQWQIIDQSRQGNDFWQTDFDPSSGTWEITYNIDMDTTNDKTLEREFKFELSSK